MTTVPNYKLDKYFQRLQEVDNYNHTIRARWYGDVYRVTHHSTTIAEYDKETGALYCLPYFYSQTTSTLTGRLLRSLPRESVRACVAAIAAVSPSDGRRLSRMARL